MVLAVFTLDMLPPFKTVKFYRGKPPALTYDDREILALLASLFEDVSVVIPEEEIIYEHSRWEGNGSITKTRGDITPEMCDVILDIVI